VKWPFCRIFAVFARLKAFLFSTFPFNFILTDGEWVASPVFDVALSPGNGHFSGKKSCAEIEKQGCHECPLQNASFVRPSQLGCQKFSILLLNKSTTGMKRKYPTVVEISSKNRGTVTFCDN
jgi:hypothetical protein